jgi:hypothetical protein
MENDIKVIALRLPGTVHGAVKRMAEKERRSLNGMIVWILAEEVEQQRFVHLSEPMAREAPALKVPGDEPDIVVIPANPPVQVTSTHGPRGSCRVYRCGQCLALGKTF